MSKFIKLLIIVVIIGYIGGYIIGLLLPKVGIQPQALPKIHQQ